MALGISGSNGGIADNDSISQFGEIRLADESPIEVSYFVNDKCNLRCSHCYVGHHSSEGLSVGEFGGVFFDLMELGALTFGNVGMEPLINWEDKTLPLLQFFQRAREKNDALRYGLVTNATLFDDRKVGQLIDANPTYLDVSLDGGKEVHESIRGAGNFDKTTQALREIFGRASSFDDKTFISFTLMAPNSSAKSLDDFFGVVREVGAKKVLISPYVQSMNSPDPAKLALSFERVGQVYQELVDRQDELLPEGGQLLLKSDFDTQKPLIDHLVNKGIVDLGRLLVDSYGVVFNKYHGKKGEVIVNYIPGVGVTQRQIRISHDGCVGNCYGMFFGDFAQTSLGNCRDMSREDLERVVSPEGVASMMVPLKGRLGKIK